MCFAKYFNFLLWMGRGEGSVGSPDPRIISEGGGGEKGGRKRLERIKNWYRTGKRKLCCAGIL
jgi:hypothetical protein